LCNTAIILLIIITFYLTKGTAWAWASLVIVLILGVFDVFIGIIIQMSSNFSTSTDIYQLITIPLKIIVLGACLSNT